MKKILSIIMDEFAFSSPILIPPSVIETSFVKHTPVRIGRSENMTWNGWTDEVVLRVKSLPVVNWGFIFNVTVIHKG